MDERVIALFEKLNDEEKKLFEAQFSAVKKDTTSFVLLALCLGGIGMHHFYLGKITRGVFYLLFCWTFIPALLGIIEVFHASSDVADYNYARAAEICSRFQTKTRSTTEEKTCPKCAETIKAAAILCKHCGHSFSEA